PAEAAELDRRSQERGVAAGTLMEAAGREVADAALRLLGGAYGRRAAVVCGKGSNGGDGLVAARYLDTAGVRTTAVLMDEGFGEPARANLERLAVTSVRRRAFSAAAIGRELARADVAVDAIFGTGFRGTPDGPYADAIEVLNASTVPVVAVDIPSGVNGETGGVDGTAVRADLTVTFGAAKPGLVLLPGATFAGVVEVEPIGVPEDLIRSDLRLLEGGDVAAMVPARAPDTHKRASGYAAVVGGSRLMTGAVALAGAAAYRAGAGLVAIAVPEGILPVAQGTVREAVFVGLPETDTGSAAGGSARLDEVLAQADALAVGPGMTTDERTAGWIRELVRSSEVPVVLDADGLNAFVGRNEDLADRKAELILTPHAGEFARLTEVSAGAVEADRVRHVRELSARTSATVLLKGSRTLVGTPDGVVRINPTGGPFLATGGTGDVLTGMIAGLLARGCSPADAGSAAAYVHGLAGRRAADVLGDGTTAVDVLGRVPLAMREVVGA
ncbi:MAG TPA: NAD(P)H-hydrate dehydratase, partial [Actinomycetota bacterium]|nr:NAD(P)H-hydrate dehydratase [Actinomycetota bacterium]